MELAGEKYKYKRHGENQSRLILTTAEKLFTEKGIDNVSLSDIAKECGVMRATVYHYYDSKDKILWEILHRYSLEFSGMLKASFTLTGGSTYERFETYIGVLYKTFVENPQCYKFYSIFSDIYQSATINNDNGIYKEIFQEDEFGSGDTVRFLMDNFHDGSVKAGLEPRLTAVSVTYGAISIVTQLSKYLHILPAKYGVSAEDIVRTSLNALLENIKG